MDFARKIGKPDELPTWKKERILFVTTRDKPLSVDVDFISEDRRFLNWKKWIAERKKLSRHIECTTGRSQVDQLHNLTSRFRTFVEMKDLMAHAAIPIPVIPDKYRGGPEFWRTLEYLPDRGDTCLPQISLAPTRKDLNLPPDLMCVGLPDLTMKEQSLIALKTKKDDLWKRSEYLKTRKLELAEEIALLLPKEPEIATLAIQGRRTLDVDIRKKKSKEQQIPIIRSDNTEADNKEELHSEDADQVVILKIQDREFTWKKCFSKTQLANSDPITWSLIFESKIDESVEKEIVLENKGTRVIVYYWRNSSFQSSNMNFEKRGSPFFFNKTKGLVLLGKTVKIKVWYLSRNRGVFTESWRLVTEPKLNPSAFILRFWGCTIDEKYLKLTNYRIINKYLDCCIRDSIIRMIIEEIVNSAECSELPEPAYEMLLSRGDFFSSYNVFHYYHPSIVMQLQKIYHDIANESAQVWNLSLNTLRDILLQIENMDYKQYMLAQFNDLCKQSLRSDLTRFDIARSSKYDTVYNILCGFANLFDNENEFVKKNCLIQRDLISIATSCQKLVSQTSEISLQTFENNSLQTRNEKLIDQSQEMLIEEKEESFNLNFQLYREIFFIRIYKALEEAIERICANLDSYIKLNELNKYKI